MMTCWCIVIMCCWLCTMCVEGQVNHLDRWNNDTYTHWLTTVVVTTTYDNDDNYWVKWIIIDVMIDLCSIHINDTHCLFCLLLLSSTMNITISSIISGIKVMLTKQTKVSQSMWLKHHHHWIIWLIIINTDSIIIVYVLLI